GMLPAGASAAGTPFNASFLLVIAFVISCAIPSLVLSADVAERKAIEARLRQQTQDLRTVFGQALVGIARIDTTGRFTFLNQRFCELVQRPMDELTRQRIQDIV